MKKLIKVLISFSCLICILSLKEAKAKTENVDMKVSVLKNQIVITIMNNQKKANLYGYRANHYYSKNEYVGISHDIMKFGDYQIGNTNGASKQTFIIDRYDESGYDRLYDKYYLIGTNMQVIKGPVYATSIDHQYGSVGFIQNTKKGLFNENSTNMECAKDLKVSSITINFDIGHIFYSQDHPQDALSFKSNGQTYYFNKSVVKHYDALISSASKNAMNVVANIIPFNIHDENIYPLVLRYKGVEDYPYYNGTNTANDQGRNDYLAIMEFIANRYSQSAEHGYITTYVLGNEVDFTHKFYQCTNLNEFMAEYERSMRLANLAVKKYASNADVAICVTHYWNSDGTKLGKESPKGALKPLEMLNWLNLVTNAQGAYDWALAPHSYGCYVGVYNHLYQDSKCHWINGNYKTSPQITFTNLEVLQEYLSQKSSRYQGKIRSVYLNEGGSSSGKDTKAYRATQAGNVASSYYKIAHLSCIKSFNYYRLKDHYIEYQVNLRSGLLDKDGKKKPAYYVYKYIDTYQSRKYADPYLKYLYFKKNGKQLYTYQNKKIKSYKDTMSVYSGYSWKNFSYHNALMNSLKKNDPGEVQNLKVKRKGKTAIVISFKKAPCKPLGYRIKVSSRKSIYTKKTKATIGKLKRHKKYQITIQAYRVINKKKQYGFSEQTTMKIS